MAKTAEQIAATIALRRLAKRRARTARILMCTMAGAAAVAVSTVGLYAYVRFASGAPASRVWLGQAKPATVPRPPDEVTPGNIPVSEDEARTINQGVLVSALPLELAAPFTLPLATGGPLNRDAAVDCLAAAVFYESANESMQGQRAVAQVVLNRMRHPAYPKSACGVVYQGAERSTGCQFSFTCDGSLNRRPSIAGWARARAVAVTALGGLVEPSVGTATHYHADYVVPYWASSLDKVATIGAHIFYRWKGYWGKRSAFTGKYVGETAPSVAAVSATGVAEQDSETPAMSPAIDTGPRPLADQIGRMATPEEFVAPLHDVRPRADQDRGTLKVDQNAGILIAGERRAGPRQ